METATSISSNPRTVEDIYKDFKSRRSAIIRALTVDADLFFSVCDPEKENLCLYGYPNDTWEVNLPAEEVPPELPEPVLGINFARDGMQKSEWLSLVAVHSDAWLISVAFFHGARFNSLERKKLYSMINDIPTVFELVTQKHQAKEKQSSTNGSKSTNLGKRVSNGAIKKTSKASLEEEQHENYKDEEDDERNDTTCGICNGMYKETEFWIECDICEKWFHGKCVKVSESRAHYIKQYKCPLCCSKKPR